MIKDYLGYEVESTYPLPEWVRNQLFCALDLPQTALVQTRIAELMKRFQIDLIGRKAKEGDSCTHIIYSTQKVENTFKVRQLSEVGFVLIKEFHLSPIDRATYWFRNLQFRL